MISLISLIFIAYLNTIRSEITILHVNATKACTSEQPLKVEMKQGFLSSPEYDNFHYYPSNKNCSWEITAPKGQVVVLKRMEFGLNTNCSLDYLEIWEGTLQNGWEAGRYCGYYAPTIYRSRTNILSLRFRSGPRPTNTGFQFYFKHGFPFVQCTQNQILCRHRTKCVEKIKACDGIDDCGDGTDEENCDEVLIEKPCGQPAITPVLGNFRIVGGREAKPGSWPWQVSLRQIDMEPFSHICGGTLISRKWIVTAAHCFKRKTDINIWNVLLGKHHQLVPDEYEQLRYIKSIHIHPDYKGNDANFSTPWLIRKKNDIALIELNAPVDINSTVSTACLPSDRARLAPGEECYVTGWGETYKTGSEFVLKQAAVPTMSRETCRKMHFLYPIDETMICAGYSQGGHDSCNGDSGGPLVNHRNNTYWTFFGVVSTGGSICAEKDQPGIYTYVPYYVQWISEVTRLVIPGIV